MQKKDEDRAVLQRELNKQINDKMIYKETQDLTKAEDAKEVDRNQVIMGQIKQEKKKIKESTIRDNVETWNMQQKMRKKAEQLQYI